MQLKSTEFVEGHLCTHPDHLFTDLNTMRFMVDQLRLLLQTPQRYQHLGQPVFLHLPDEANWLHRFVVTQPERLQNAAQLTLVGFFGQRREGVDPTRASEFDRILVKDIGNNPDLLSYYSLALACGNFSNLVIFTNAEAKRKWGSNRAHAQAAERFAPDYYLSVRLYNGRLPHGLKQSRHLTLSRVKYFDYQTGPPWRAVRQIEAKEGEHAWQE